MKKNISLSKTYKYSQLGNCSKKTETIWIVLHGYGMLSEYFIKKFECISNDHTVIIAPEGSNRFYLANNYARVGASWMTKLDKEIDIEENISFLNTLYNKIITEIGHTNFKLKTLGFSQGGPTLTRWIMSNTYPVDTLILWGSDIPKDTLLIDNMLRWDTFNIKLVIGKKDEYIDKENKKRVINLINSFGIKYELIEYDGNHKIIEEELVKIAAGI